MFWYDYVLGSVIMLFAIVIIAVILLQEGRRKGLSGAIAGGADTFLAKGKARAVDAILARWTKIVAIAFVVLVLGSNVLTFIFK